MGRIQGISGNLNSHTIVKWPILQVRRIHLHFTLSWILLLFQLNASMNRHPGTKRRREVGGVVPQFPRVHVRGQHGPWGRGYPQPRGHPILQDGRQRSEQHGRRQAPVRLQGQGKVLVQFKKRVIFFFFLCSGALFLNYFSRVKKFCPTEPKTTIILCAFLYNWLSTILIVIEFKRCWLWLSFVPHLKVVDHICSLKMWDWIEIMVCRSKYHVGTLRIKIRTGN